MKFGITGLIVAPCTPMHENGSINLSPVGQYAIYLSKTQKVENLFILGTTGEGQNMTVQERKLVAEEWMKTGRNLFNRIIVHVGGGNLMETQELAKHARHINADAVAIAPPTYFKPYSVQSLAKYIADVAKVVEDMPVLYYHLPEVTGADFAMIDFLDRVVDSIPNFAGMKFVTFLLSDFGRCMRKYGDKVEIAYGKEGALLFAAMMGGTSFVGAAFNYMGKLFKEMFDLYKANNITAAVAKQQDIHEIHAKIGHVGNLKALTARISGIPLGPTRSPIRPAENVEMIVKVVEETGLIQLS